MSCALLIQWQTRTSTKGSGWYYMQQSIVPRKVSRLEVPLAPIDRVRVVTDHPHTVMVGSEPSHWHRGSRTEPSRHVGPRIDEHLRYINCQELYHT